LPQPAIVSSAFFWTKLHRGMADRVAVARVEIVEVRISHLASVALPIQILLTSGKLVANALPS